MRHLVTCLLLSLSFLFCSIVEESSVISGNIIYEGAAPTDTVYVGLYPLGSDRLLGGYEQLEKIMDTNFKMEVDPGLYTLAIYSFEFELYRELIYIPDNKTKFHLDINLPRVGIPADISEVKIKASYCKWRIKDAVELDKEDGVWKLKDTSILKKGERYQIMVNGLHRWDMKEKNYDIIHGWTTINSLYSGGDVIFDPSLYRQPMKDADVKITGVAHDYDLKMLAQNIFFLKDQVRSTQMNMRNFSESQLDSTYQFLINQFDKLEEKYKNPFEQVFLEQRISSLSYSHPAFYKLRKLWREARGDTSIINAFYQSDIIVDYFKDNIELFQRLKPDSYLLNGNFARNFSSLDYYLKKSPRIRKELNLKNDHFFEKLMGFAENTKSKSCAATIYYSLGSNYARSDINDDQQKGELLLKRLKNDFPKSRYVTGDYVDNLLQGLKVVVGNKAPVFNVETLNGDSLSLSKLKGKFVFLDFWGSWCGPCRGEIPNIKKLYTSFSRDDLFVLGMAKDDSTDLINCIKKENITYPNTLASKELIKEYGITSYPTTLLIAPDGKILAKNLRGEKLVKLVKKKMEENKKKSSS
jgi:thiol-disulfide isomerase/thioredoxin